MIQNLMCGVIELGCHLSNQKLEHKVILMYSLLVYLEMLCLCGMNQK